MEYDFSGWATRNNIECSDGRIIMKDAFKNDDGLKVPLVWNHQHNSPDEVLGHALLENRDEGVYAYCKFNDTDSGKTAKSLVVNGDVDRLSIYANKLKSLKNQEEIQIYSWDLPNIKIATRNDTMTITKNKCKIKIQF